MVNVGGTECMCGGTHVKNTADIRNFTATKIKKVYTFINNSHACGASYAYYYRSDSFMYRHSLSIYCYVFSYRTRKYPSILYS